MEGELDFDTLILPKNSKGRDQNNWGGQKSNFHDPI